VHNVDGAYKITWGNLTKEFTADQLSHGINLAAEFLDNPFSGPFQQVEAAIRRQQDFETPLVKNMLHNMPEYRRLLPEAADTLSQLAAAGLNHDCESMKKSSAAVKPVTHKLVIERK
jgi:hypothetical protein